MDDASRQMLYVKETRKAQMSVLKGLQYGCSTWKAGGFFHAEICMTNIFMFYIFFSNLFVCCEYISHWNFSVIWRHHQIIMKTRCVCETLMSLSGSLWRRLKFLKYMSNSKVKVKRFNCWYQKKVLSQGIQLWSMKSRAQPPHSYGLV